MGLPSMMTSPRFFSVAVQFLTILAFQLRYSHTQGQCYPCGGPDFVLENPDQGIPSVAGNLLTCRNLEAESIGFEDGSEDCIQFQTFINNVCGCVPADGPRCYACGGPDFVAANPDSGVPSISGPEVKCTELVETSFPSVSEDLSENCIEFQNMVNSICGCIPASEAPSLTPSSPPSAAPTEDGGFQLCFSRSNTVLNKDRGIIPISEVIVGDYILADGNKFEQVYSLAHYDPTKKAAFIQVTTAETNDAPLELTPKHMVFTGAGKAVMAKSLRAGDSVLLPNGDSAEIQSIKVVQSEGLFAPFTASGTLVVNGIVASSYIDVVDIPWAVSSQWLENVFQIPHRTICTFRLDWCKQETYTEEGVSRWVSAPLYFVQWVSRQHVVVRGVVYAIAIILVGFFGILAEIYGYVLPIILTCFMVVGAANVLWNGKWTVSLNGFETKTSFGSKKEVITKY